MERNFEILALLAKEAMISRWALVEFERGAPTGLNRLEADGSASREYGPWVFPAIELAFGRVRFGPIDKVLMEMIEPPFTRAFWDGIPPDGN